MQKIISFIEGTVCGAFLPAVLFISGIVMFLKIGIYIFSPRFFVRNIRKNEGSSLSSLWLALGGTLGVGNICGVCAAIYLGGAGCVFWIWVCAIISSVIKYSETVLAIRFRSSRHSGAHSYISDALKAPTLAKAFCMLCVITAFTMGNVTQVKAAADFTRLSLKIPTEVSASVFFLSVLMLSLGKGNAIKKFTSKTVPLLCVFYTVCCVAVIIVFRENIGSVTERIFKEAFTPKAGISGFLGYICSPAIRLGITRGVMSNEAGCGTAPIAYAFDTRATPVNSGLLGVIEVLCDTLLLCTLTAYAVMLPKTPLSESSAQSVISAFSSALGRAIVPLLGISVFLFSLASVSAWSFYALQSAAYLGFKKRFHILFSIAFSLTAFLGCYAKENVVWVLADTSVALMAIINILAILLLFGTVNDITKNEYNSTIKTK